jgi:hypothetical protein
MIPHRFSVVLIFMLGSSNCFSQFRYQRSIAEASAEGWYAIHLDESILSKLNTAFSDVRIVSKENIEVPYLLRVAAEEVQRESIGLKVANISKRDNDLFFTVRVPENTDVNHASIELLDKNYDVNVLVEGGANEKEWYELAKDKRIVSVFDRNINYTSSTITWPVSTYPLLRFKIVKGASLTFSKVFFSMQKVKRGVYDQAIFKPTLITKDNVTELNIDLRSTRYLSKLFMEPAAGQKFYRNYRIENLDDSVRTEKGWIKNFNVVHQGVISSFTQDTIRFGSTLCRSIRIIIFNEDNPPIQLTSVTTWSPHVNLVMLLKQGKYLLKYRNPKIGNGNYDLGHFESEIPDRLNYLTLGQVETLSTDIAMVTQPWFKNKNWLWGIMLIIVGMLGFFTIRMLRKA